MNRKGQVKDQGDGGAETNSRIVSTPCRRATRVPVGRSSKYGGEQAQEVTEDLAAEHGIDAVAGVQHQVRRSQVMPLVKSMNITKATQDDEGAVGLMDDDLVDDDLGEQRRGRSRRAGWRGWRAARRATASCV